ncbi:hypothetical protein A3K74_00290 [Candidatus Pacearchaeota archaeon RBG_13_33_26]|nr:MAG: hypothetical protein A3K74_00290 [Candidatus Pacearchaeota archaeon RBG_13_33_26]
MRLRNKFLSGIFFIFVILFLGFISAAYTRSNVQWSQYNPTTSQKLDQSVCKQGQDFIIQISPFGCTPAVVRTDLLEENDVPVYCQLGATKINPLIDVQTIDTVSFTGQYPKEVAGIGFHPAKAALGVEDNLNSPVLNNIGYIVILLKKQQNASAVPEYVSGNLTAKIKYNIKKAFGIGNALFYLPELNDEEFENKKSQYSFWSGKGTIRADAIDSDSAQISVYQNDRIISSVNLQKGKTSDSIYLPGFQCQAGLKLRLDGLENPDTRAKLRINSEVVEVAKCDGGVLGLGTSCEKFLDNKCEVIDLSKNGFVQQVKIKCQEDDKKVTTSTLTITPSVTIKIGDNEAKEYKLGDMLYDGGAKKLYLGYIGETKAGRRFIVPVVSPQPDSEKFKQSFIYQQLPNFIDIVSTYSKGLVVDLFLRTTGALTIIGQTIAEGSYPIGMFGEGGGRVDFSFDIASAFVVTSETSFLYRFYDPSVITPPVTLITIEGVTETYIPLTFVGFANPQDVELTGEVKTNYENAKKDYKAIRESYSSEQFSKDERFTFGEEALYKEILLAWHANQKVTVVELCREFESSYPDSTRIIEECDNAIKLANQDVEDMYVTINGQVKQISFDGIYEPTADEYSAEVLIENAGNYSGTRIFRKNQRIQISATESLSLNGIGVDPAGGEESATFDTSTIDGGLNLNDIVYKAGYITLKLNDYQIVGKNRYKITLTKLNLKKLAKVSVIPNIDNAGTTANFSFKIGIEKRAIDLPPDKIRDMIKNLDSEIKQWTDISSSLGNVTRGLKTACLVTGATLVAKNFLFGGVSGIARQEVMRGKDGWYEKCADFVNDRTYSSQEECYTKNADKIDKDVDELSKLVEQQNNNIKSLEQGITTSQFLTDRVVNTSAFIDRYAPQVSSYVKQNLPDTITDLENKGEPVNKNEILTILTYDNWKNKNAYSMEQLRDIELYSKVLNDPSASTELKGIAQSELYSTLLDIKTTSEVYQFATSFDDELRNKGLTEVGATESYGNERSIKGVYNGGTIKGSQLVGLDSATIYPAKSITYNNKKYLLVLEGTGENYFIKKIYDGVSLSAVSSGEESQIKNAFSSFRKIDASSYKNQYKNARLRYYETEPYKGMPAVVPFDLKNGWYAAMKQTLPVGANIQTYEASGRVSSFYLCNTGGNGLEEFQTIGDDICEMINTGTGMPYNAFHRLDEKEARNIINKAVEAIKQASNIPESQRKGYVSILGQRVQVGEPAVDVPQFECQDFMSPKECLLLFNLCDPVICPSSRCDFGGAYPVKDVVQTGVIGSIALCLPNFKEGIIVPVCLTGVQAGIDGFLSIKTSYRDCLNESLETGKMVGICDEIYSIYICDFFWKQALPLADIIIPKMFELFSGQNVKGGGEYLGVASAWETAGKAVDYFVSYYGANAKEAFIKRTTETAKSEVCKSFVSGVTLSGGDLLSTLTAPDSPVQFHGRFDEIALTTATVPPTSHYKVFYHIYAGKDSGAYYQVYLKGTPTSSYYQDITQNLVIGSGYIAVGGYASETIDKVATSGYNQMCINVNGQEECGFKEVSTSFAVNYIKDKYLASQATEMDIKTESACISGTSSIYSLLNPNVQSAAESVINPAIYEKGIIRICATDNPGTGTDVNRYAGTGVTGKVISGITGGAVNIPAPEETPTPTPEQTPTETPIETPTEEPTEEEIIKGLIENPGVREGPRWVAVGYCDNEKIKCWLDTESVKNVIKTTTVEGEALDEITNNYLEVLKNEGGYLSNEQFSSAIQEIEKEKDNSKKIKLINNIFEKVFWSGEKVRLLYLRGNAYAEIFKVLWSKLPKSETSIGGITQIPLTSGEGGLSIWQAAKNLVDNKWDETRNPVTCKGNSDFDCIYDYVCARFTLHAMINAQVKDFLNSDGKSCSLGVCTIANGKMTFNSNSHTSWESIDYTIKNLFTISKNWAEITDFNSFQKGDLIILGYGNEKTQHITIFDSYSEDKKTVNVFGDPGIVRSGMWINPSQVEHYPVKSMPSLPKRGEWYIYRVFRYLGEGGATITTGEKPAEEGTGIIPSGTTQEETMGYKIFRAASDAAYKSKDPAVKFVVTSINNAGVKGIDSQIASVQGLSSALNKNEHFVEVNLNNIGNLKLGDVVLLGMECKRDYSVGIFHSTSNQVYFFSNVDFSNSKGVELESIPRESPLEMHHTISFDLADNLYIYKAYRYTEGFSEAERNSIKAGIRTPWTLDSALAEISTRKGNYNDNKIFFDQLVFDGLLTEQECNEIGRTNIFGVFQKDISWLHKILLGKKLSSG